MTDNRTNEQKLASLQSERRDVLAQIRRNIHTARSDGCHKYLAKIDKQIRELETQSH